MISSTQIHTLDMSSFSNDFSEVPDPTFLLLDPVEITFPPFDRTAFLRGDKRTSPTALSVDKYVSQDCGTRPNLSQPSCHRITARRCVLPGKFTWRLSIILQHAQTPAQGQCFEISQTTSSNPKS